MSTQSHTFIPLKQVAEVNNVAQQSVAEWLKRRKLYQYPYRKTSGRQYLIRIDAAERYAEGRIGVKPKDYVTVKGLCAEMGISRGGSFMRQTLLKGVSPQLFRGTAYLSPEDAATVLARWKKLQPAHGWLPIRQAAPVIGRTRQGVIHWANRNGVEVREYYDGEQLKVFIQERQLLTYLRTITKTGRSPR